MNSRGFGDQAVAWLQALPVELSSSVVLRAARFEAHIAARQGRECADWLGSEDWGPDDHLRLALLTRVQLALGRQDLGEAAWAEAVEKGGRTPRGRRALWQTATESGWRDKALAMLRLSASAPTDRQWALTLLFDHYSRIPDSTNMLAVSREMLAVNPEDTMIRNNVAALSLLLKDDMEKGHRLARLAWAERSKDPAILATYGYSLFLQGKSEDALEMFERIPPQFAAHPSIAVYYAAVLAANGQMKKAQPFIKVADGGNILPEERELLADTVRQSMLFTE
jgi:Flp pilus assembly protein TadD